MTYISLTGEEKLTPAFLSQILLSLRNGTSSSHLPYCLFSSGEGCEAESSGSQGSFFSNGNRHGILKTKNTQDSTKWHNQSKQFPAWLLDVSTFKPLNFCLRLYSLS